MCVLYTEIDVYQKSEYVNRFRKVYQSSGEQMYKK